MTTDKMAVAISTTGDEHRLGFLETAVKQWDMVLHDGGWLFVTVDGDEAACDRVLDTVDYWTLSVFRVGQVGLGIPDRMRYRDGRQGVAVNKNTGLELMMDETGAEHLFLCDDDTWPLNTWSLLKHTRIAETVPHSMVCWGGSRLVESYEHHASWNWPRGAMLYTHRDVVEMVGGMDERFGPGGHEHVEWSRRIHQHGLTPDLYCSPRVYAEAGELGRGTRAASFWHAEDMRRLGEPMGNHRLRRSKLTSVRRKGSDWDHIEKIMESRDGDTSYVGFRAHENGRASATLCSTSTGQGAGGEG